jgi:hypothetical protein
MHPATVTAVLDRVYAVTRHERDEQHIGVEVPPLATGFCVVGLGLLGWRLVFPSLATDSFFVGAAAAVVLAWLACPALSGPADALVAAPLAEGRCPGCGYELEGVPREADDGCTVCPECGAAWRPPEHPCRRCGHELARMPPGPEVRVRCPACGDAGNVLLHGR